MFKGRESVPVCSVHNRYQSANGRWLDQDLDNFQDHLVFCCTQDCIELETICDLCDNPSQIEIEFEEL